MSSGFVSGGTNDAPIQRDDAWLKAQLELEAERKAKADRAKAANEGRSLFETLEANKAAKQEAFEEANRLKNQFRALDDDEVAFLEEIREKERIEAARVKKETEEGLEAFRRLREEAEKAEKEKEATLAKSELKAADEEWDFKSKKRKAGPVKLRLNLGIKHRKLSGDTDAGNQDLKEVEKPVASEDKACKDDTEGAKPDSLGAKSASADLETEKKPAAGLVAYALDDDDDW